MRQKGVLILLMPLIFLMASTCIWADKMTIDIRAWIDHYDTLYIDDANDTLQWKYQGRVEPCWFRRLYMAKPSTNACQYF